MTLLVLMAGCGSSSAPEGKADTGLGDTGFVDAPGDIGKVDTADVPVDRIPGDTWIPDVPPGDLPGDLLDVPDLDLLVPDVPDVDVPGPDASDVDAVEPDVPEVLDVADVLDPDSVHPEVEPEVEEPVMCPGGGFLLGDDCGAVPAMGCCHGQTLHRCLAEPDCPPGFESCLCALDCVAEGTGNEPGMAPYCSFLAASAAFGCAAELSFPPTWYSGPFWCEGYQCLPECQGRNCGSDGCGGSCGTCLANQECSADGVCVATCVPETASVLCTAANRNCGAFATTDSCGTQRNVDCGLCSLPETCGGGGQEGRCGCTPQNDGEFCSFWQATCGTITRNDNCGVTRMVVCGGECPEFCAGAGVSRCQGNAVQRCVDDGGLWVWSDDLEPCEFGAVCSNGECTLTPNPPDPADIAPELDPMGPYDLYIANSFLWTSSDPVQFDVQPEAIQPHRIAMVRGRVLDVEGWPLPGVRVNNAFDASVGYTVSRADGAYDLADNGGTRITMEFRKEGYLPIQRSFNVTWHQEMPLPDVRMTAIEPVSTEVTLGESSIDLQVASGTVQADADGPRQVRLLFAPGTTAEMDLPDGTILPLSDSITVRATEYTVGEDGPQAMPAELPTGTQYTWCGEFTVDEALEAGATSVRFSQPVVGYIENFLGFPTGAIVPVGTYDRSRARWQGEENGLVMTVLDLVDGLARFDLDGSGTPGAPEDLESMGITDEERALVAQHFQPGDSVWRFRVDHFTPVDLNWFEKDWVEETNKARRSRPTSRQRSHENVCKDGGCVVHPIEQRLQERVTIPESPVTLYYDSVRVPDKQAVVRIPLYRGVPHIAGRVDLLVAGQRLWSLFHESDKMVELAWDGRDNSGRAVRSPVTATVVKLYVYPVAYISYFGLPTLLPPLFGSLGESDTTIDVDGVERSVDYPRQGFVDDVFLIPGLDERPLGLGGWNLEQHHRVFPSVRMIFEGNGNRREYGATQASHSTRRLTCHHPMFPGMVYACKPGNSGYGSQVQILPDGRPWIGPMVRNPDGSWYTYIGGGGSPAYDGIPAESSNLIVISGNSVGQDGDLYFTSGQATYLWRRDPAGRLWRVAGNGFCTDCPFPTDGASARDVRISAAFPVAHSDGTVWLKTSGAGGTNRLWRIDISGRMWFMGDPEASTKRGFDPFNGNLYRTYNESIRHLTSCPDGTTVFEATHKPLGGNQTRYLLRAWSSGAYQIIAGGGGAGYPSMTEPALGGSLSAVSGISCAPDGTVYFGQQVTSDAPLGFSYAVYRLRDGFIERVAGGGPTAASPVLDGTAALWAHFPGLDGFALNPEGTLFVFTGSELYEVAHSLNPGGLSSDEVGVPSDDGQRRFVFHGGSHRHLRTEYAATGEALYSFQYDPQGRLAAVEDHFGGMTVVNRGPGGQLQSITAPSGAVTQLGTDGNGFLNTIALPGQAPFQFTYSQGGLMQSAVYPDGGLHQYQYDATGALLSVQRPDGSMTGYQRQEDHDSMSIFVTRQALPDEEHRYDYNDDGSMTYTRHVAGQERNRLDYLGQRTVRTSPDGTVIENTTVPDPGNPEVSLTSTISYTTPGGRRATGSVSRQVVKDVVTGEVIQHTSSMSLNASPSQATTVADLNQKTLVLRTAAGVESRYELDLLGRPSLMERDGLAPLRIERDGAGRQTALLWGPVRVERWYDQSGRLMAIRDGLQRWRHVLRDEFGRVLQQELAPDVWLGFGHDAAGRVNRFDLPGGASYSYDYAANGKWSRLTYPDGSHLQRHFDEMGLTRTVLPSGRGVDVQRGPEGNYRGFHSLETALGLVGDGSCCGASFQGIHSVLGSGLSQTTAVEYDGGVLVSMEVSGASQGRFEFFYPGDSVLPGSYSVTLGSDVTPIPVVFNQDIKLTQHGPLTILRDGPMGTASEYHDATARWTVAFDEIGRFIGRELILGGTVVYHLDVELDEASRVTGMTETLNGVALEWGFAYDQQDRLVETSRDGVVTETYTYDDRGNRLSWWTAEHGAQTATYDLSDRLLFLGDEAQVFNADGQCTQVRGLELTYATRGELLQSSVAGQQWQYAYDLIGRQVMRQGAGGARTVLFGPIASPWLPAGARLEDGTELLFFYDELGTLLRIHRDGVPYYVASDQVGTPRAVFDQAGTLVKEISRDSFGNILSDSNDAWDMVLGFAGGVEDPATGLIRFGLRDYDPVTGRFLTLDPLLFNVPQTHLYAYSRNTPQTRRDPSGLLCVGLGMFNVVGVAGEICLDDDGISACGEAGVGWGSGWDLDFFGGLQDTDWGVEVEASADFLGAGGEAKFNVSRCKGMRQSYDFGGPGNRMGFESQYDPNSEEWGDWDPGYSADLKQATDSMDKIDSVIDHFTKGGSGKKGLKMGAGGHVSATLKACAQLGW